MSLFDVGLAVGIYVLSIAVMLVVEARTGLISEIFGKGGEG